MIERLLPIAASLLAGSLRLRWQGEPLPGRSVVMFWHGKMFAGWYSVRKRKPIALVSRSKDGQLLSNVLAHWKYKLALGSSGKKGMEALTEAIERLNSGEANTFVITPDGPRGPHHQFKRGAFLAAGELGLPLLMLRIRYDSAIRLSRSWDKFEVPLPFSRVSIEVKRVDMQDMPLHDIDLQRAWLEGASKLYSE